MSVSDTTAATLQAFYDCRDWQGILTATESVDHFTSASPLFQRARAFFELGQFDAATGAVEAGLTIQPNSEWGTVLKHNILKGSGEIDGAIECLRRFIEEYPTHARDGVRALLVDQAAEYSKYDLAVATNDARNIFAVHKPAQYAVALQCFAKNDTLERSLQALLQCRQSQKFMLFILQDSLSGAKKADQYREGHARVRELIAAHLADLGNQFHSVTFLQNQVNMGPTASCRRLLDHVADHASAFVFLEDDCLLAPDALEWASFHLEHTITADGVMIGACESIFFDARNRTPTEAQREALTNVARNEEHRWAHVLQEFVPSTCFFTKSEIWHGIASIRSFPRGDRNLSSYLRDRGYHCIMPVVPRASDIGMLDALGYSVNTLGRERVAETKNSYVQSVNETPDPTRMTLYRGNKGLLFDASVNFNDLALRKLTCQPVAQL